MSPLLSAAAEPTAAGLPQWATLVLAVLVAAGGIGGVLSFLNAPKMRKKIDADTAEVLTGAAVALVKPLQEQIEALTRRVNAWETRDRMHKQLLGDHKAWDDLAMAVAAEAGMDLPRPPTLYPPALES